LSKLLTAIAVTLIASVAGAQEWHEPDEQGLTFSFGYGPGFSGLGVGVGYTGSLSPELHVMPYVGAGFFDAKRIHDDHDTKVLWGPGGGVLIQHGGQHRLVLDVTYGIVNHEVFTLHGYLAGARAIWGISTMLGYGFVNYRGFNIRGEVGPSFAVFPYTVSEHVTLNIGIILGYTFL
jgi:hypothetical protein